MKKNKTWGHCHNKATKLTANNDLRGNSQDYRKAALFSLISDAPCWVGTCPETFTWSFLSCTTSLSTTEQRKGPHTSRSWNITKGGWLLANVSDAFPGWARCPRVSGELIWKEAGKGLPQAPDGLRFGFILIGWRPEEGGLREAEGICQGLRLAWR